MLLYQFQVTKVIIYNNRSIQSDTWYIIYTQTSYDIVTHKMTSDVVNIKFDIIETEMF